MSKTRRKHFFAPDRQKNPRRHYGKEPHPKPERHKAPPIALESCPSCGSDNIWAGTTCLACGLTLP
jgi:hypothetical protein